MHCCTVAFLDEYPLPDSCTEAFMLTLVCLLTHSCWTETPLPESYLLKRNSASYPLNKKIYAHTCYTFRCKVEGRWCENN